MTDKELENIKMGERYLLASGLKGMFINSYECYGISDKEPHMVYDFLIEGQLFKDEVGGYYPTHAIAIDIISKL